MLKKCDEGGRETVRDKNESYVDKQVRKKNEINYGIY